MNHITTNHRDEFCATTKDSADVLSIVITLDKPRKSFLTVSAN